MSPSKKNHSSFLPSLAEYERTNRYITTTNAELPFHPPITAETPFTPENFFFYIQLRAISRCSLPHPHRKASCLKTGVNLI